MSATSTAAGTMTPFPLRKTTGTANFHLTSKTVDFGLEDLEKLRARDALQFFAELRWGSSKEMPCPHCRTFDSHYWSPLESRWKCKCCGKRFSVTSKTVFADHKLTLLKILKILLSWSNGSSGKPALQLRRDWKVAYGTVYMLLQKLREGFLRGDNQGFLCGVHEMDGMDALGRRYREKRNKPLGGGSAGGAPKIPAALLKDPKDFVGPPTPPKYGKAAKQPHDRRILLTLRQRGVQKGKGGVKTRIAVAITEAAATVTTAASRVASAESTILTDEDPSYSSFGSRFAEHRTVNHSKAYVAADGTNNNQAESFNKRVRRGLHGIYLNVSVKYLADYAAECAWREDTRRLSTLTRLRHLLTSALRVGASLWWRGWWQGHHREEELLVEGNRLAASRGRKKGAKAKAPR